MDTFYDFRSQWASHQANGSIFRLFPLIFQILEKAQVTGTSRKPALQETREQSSYDWFLLINDEGAGSSNQSAVVTYSEMTRTIQAWKIIVHSSTSYNHEFPINKFHVFAFLQSKPPPDGVQDIVRQIKVKVTGKRNEVIHAQSLMKNNLWP